MSVAMTFKLIAFEDLLKNAKDLVEIHNKLGGKPGRRFGEMSLNRAVVVLAVASWQAYIEALATEIVAYLKPPAASAQYNLIRADVMGGIGRFNTPNSRNTIDLLSRTGLDPSAGWTFSARWAWARLKTGKVYYQEESWTPPTASWELDTWLQVRHRVAHGSDFNTPDLRKLLTGTADGKPSLRKADAERCVAFIEALANATDKSAQAAFP